MLFKKLKINRLQKKIKGFQATRLHNQVSEEILQKERDLYHKLAEVYESLKRKKKFPFAQLRALECYRAASDIDDPKAQYILGKSLLEEAKCRDELQKGELFASDSNERQMKQRYEEALAYLKAAENHSHIHAKRLRGLCYINGWGVTPDKKAGFELVVASIDQENSWDKVPQIFASLGLNKPEFFSQLGEMRSKL